MKINYHNKRFESVSNSTNGEVSSYTVFHYMQEGNILTGFYSGGLIIKGLLLGKVHEDGCIDMVYQHINATGEIRTGKCLSEPFWDEQGKLHLKESWQWTNGDLSKGSSEIREI